MTGTETERAPGAQALRDAFDAAAARAGGAIERHYHIAGLDLRLRFAGPALVPVLDPALGHARLAAPPAGPPALSIDLWDGRTAGPPPHRLPLDAREAGFSVLPQPDFPALGLVDTAHGQALYYVPDAREVPAHARCAPLRTIFRAFMAARGRMLVHGAAVGTASGGVLLAGTSGAGKSTTAIACLRAPGLRYAGDDYVLVSMKPALAVHALYGSAKLHAAHARRFPDLLPFVRNPGQPPPEKAYVFVDEIDPGKPIAGFPIRVLAVSRVAADRPETRYRPASPADALRALAPCSLIFNPGAGQDTLADLAVFAKALPSVHFELGADLDGIPPAVEALLARA